MQPFSHFVGIDWTGAKGKRHAGLKVAICAAGDEAPRLVAPPGGTANWSRQECSDWISDGMGLSAATRTLIGIDAAFGYPHDSGTGYLRGDSKAENAPDLWAEIASLCKDAEDLFAGPFVQKHSRHYRYQRYNREHRVFDTVVDADYFRPLLRAPEKICISDKYGPCESVFNLIGASQVGKSALSTMIMLDQLRAHPDIAIWPFDDAGAAPIVLVEIYAAIFSKLGGGKGKVRDIRALNQTLAGLSSLPYADELPTGSSVDDVTDAVMTSAGLRHIAASPECWHPGKLSTKVRRTEGWIFGVT